MASARYNDVMVRAKSTPFTTQVLYTLCYSSLVSVALLVVRMAVAGNTRFLFIVWNLALAWLPLAFALGLRINLAKKPLLSWQNLGLLGLWLGFLPNSFYIMSDLVHLQSSGETFVLYDIAMLMSFIINGFILGYISVYLVHMQLAKYLSNRVTNTILVGVFLACGFAIYLGRYLRWNTWDIVLNPMGILFDITERVINPFLHIQTFIVTGVFAVVLTSTYAVIFQLAKVLSANVEKR